MKVSLAWTLVIKVESITYFHVLILSLLADMQETQKPPVLMAVSTDKPPESLVQLQGGKVYLLILQFLTRPEQLIY